MPTKVPTPAPAIATPAPIQAIAVAQVAAPAPAPDVVPEHVLAIISAAVHTVLGARAHIVQLTNTEDSLTWSLEGRRAIFSGRRVR